MRGIILAGGKGSRLYPLTIGVSKQLLPLYDKPMIYYPLAMLMLAGIREIMIISTSEHQSAFQKVLGDGNQWGLSFTYGIQQEPKGLAQAFIIADEFVDREPVALILGDNIFFGEGLRNRLQRAAHLEEGALIYAYPVSNPERYGVIEFDEEGIPVSIEEKPENPQSHYAVPGLYFYDNQVMEFVHRLSPSKRGEYEITDLNRMYLSKGLLQVEILGRGVVWLDAGTHQSLLQAANFIQAAEERTGMMISCPEEIAYRMGYIDDAAMREIALGMASNGYGKYLLRLLDEPMPRVGGG
jgi:glucose-1-phosphate thymidylyltransferase